MMRLATLLLACLLALPLPAAAALAPGEMLEDPVLEARARDLARELRCLVCQNQSIDDSDAELAHDLRRIVRERLVAGDGDREIRDYLVARYGDFVLLRPPVRPGTWLLWFGPLTVLLLGGGLAFAFLRERSRKSAAALPLAQEEEAELRRLLDGGGGLASEREARP